MAVEVPRGQLVGIVAIVLGVLLACDAGFLR
jgi:hypothetical protein